MTPLNLNRDAEIQALAKAIAVERRAKYIDFRGKRSTFSEFMRKTAERLCRRYPEDVRWSTIRGLFRQYPNLDVAARISILHRAEEILSPPEQATSDEHITVSSPYSISRAPARKIDASESYVGELNAPMPAASTWTTRTQPPGPAATATAISPQEASSAFSPRAVASASVAVTGREALSPAGHDAPVRPPEPAKTERSKPTTLTPRSQDPHSVDVQFIKGVGPKVAAVLERLEIRTVADLLHHYPRQHLDFQNRQSIAQLVPGEDVTIFGTIRSVGAFVSKRKSNVAILTIQISDGTGSISVSRFIGGKSNKYLLDRYKESYPKGAQVMASGTVERDAYAGRLQLKNAQIEVLGHLTDTGAELDSLHAGRLVPVYPLTEGLSLRHLREIIHNGLEMYGGAMQEPLPEEIRERWNLCPIHEALWSIHFPQDSQTLEAARRRLVFDELFLAQLKLAMRRHRFKSSSEALSLPVTSGALLEKFRQGLPFQLTGAQERVFAEISADLSSPHPMHRLVQGDVGSGKTVVAAMASLVAIENGYQVAIMAPTEILAEQHYRQFERWLVPLGLRCALFVGKHKARERKANQQGLLAGQIHVAVGTHALIQDDVEFKNLGFVVIDEQHRFGVKQRARLKGKGINPELLTMTATPIPRTLALSLHGDLDVSEIDELPPGRRPIVTEVIGAADKRRMYGFITEQILQGRQIYIVFPLIEESEMLAAKAATAEYEKLRTSVFPERSLGLMHGKLKPQEKDEVMEKFRKGGYDILVSTTVIEVGVDVPNATVMVIENADRFGLAQLHQLRGRVGRGAEQSFCFLATDSRSQTTRQRLGIMAQTNDGFVIAEKDLELRGPGEFLGTRQSGVVDLALADIVKDAKTLEEARAAALEVVRADPELKTKPLLKKFVDTDKTSESAELLTSG